MTTATLPEKNKERIGRDTSSISESTYRLFEVTSTDVIDFNDASIIKDRTYPEVVNCDGNCYHACQDYCASKCYGGCGDNCSQNGYNKY